MIKTTTCHSEVELRVAAFELPAGFCAAEESAPPKLAGDESGCVLNRKSSGADPSPAPNSFKLVYAIFLGFGSGWQVVVGAYSLAGNAWDVTMIKTTTCHSEVELRVAAFELPAGFCAAEESAPPKLAGDESGCVLNRESSGADPSPCAESFQAGVRDISGLRFGMAGRCGGGIMRASCLGT